jgi:predicted alpha/beta hydrolase family esterase
MKEDIVIFHGLGCDKTDVWIPWLAEKLRAKGHKVWTPSMPNTEMPRLEEWLEVAEHVLAETTGPLILIGHSLGGILILNLLANNWQARLQKAYLFGAPAYTKPYTPDFHDEQPDWEAIRQNPAFAENPKKLNIVWSQDDDCVFEDHFQIMQAELPTAKFHRLNGYNHFRDLTNPWLAGELNI